MSPKRMEQMIDPIYSIVFTTALLGSGHCIGMCGPLVAAFSLAGPARKQGILFNLLYNAGRILTYVLIGVAAGWAGSLLNTNQTFTLLSRAILILADLAVIAMGLRTSGIWRQLTVIHMEFPGAQHILAKAVSGFQKFPAAASAFPIGVIMGFLPCGFLYAIALAAAGRGAVLEGGLIMFFFGLGTLPALFLVGSAAQWVSSTLRTELLRWAGMMVVFTGAYNLYRHLHLAGLL